MDSVHSFEGALKRALDADLLYANPNFEGVPAEFGNAMTWELATKTGQFRIKDLGAGPALVLELEVRSPKHRSCPFTRVTEPEVEAHGRDHAPRKMQRTA